MRLVIFGDIHGNLEALEEAYEAASARGFDSIYHLGDLGGYAPFINEVADFLIDRGIEGVRGNYDEAVAKDREHCGCGYEDALQAGMMDMGFNWTKARATERTKRYLLGLPFSISLEAEGRRVKLFHASPTKNNLYWRADRDDEFFREMAAKSGADIMIYGHTHKPYRKNLDGKIFINAGSVGKPKDGDTRGCIACVDILPEAVNTEFLRFEYNLENTARAITENGMPEYFADRLREGK